MPKGDTASAIKVRDENGFKCTLEQAGKAVEITEMAAWQVERYAIRKLWRMGLLHNRDLRRQAEQNITKRIEALKNEKA
jgi:hypothetical protein